MQRPIEIIVPACAGFEPCCAPGGGTPTITGVTCVSRQGNCTLRGYSKFSDQNTGDVNMRKAKRIAWSVNPTTTVDTEYFSDGACVTKCGEAVWNVAQEHIWNPVTNTETQFGQARLVECGTEIELRNLNPCDNFSPFITHGTITPSFPDAWTKILHTNGASALGCDSGILHCCAASGSSRRAAVPSTDVTIVLYDFDSVADAQVRAGVATSNSCQTLPGTIGNGTGCPYTTLNDQISIVAPRSVVASIACANLTIGETYEITATLTRRNSSTDAFISEDDVTFNFTADGTTDTVDYDVPIETGVKVNFDSADSIVAL